MFEVHWPDSLNDLPYLARHENRSIRIWILPNGHGRILIKCLAPQYTERDESFHASEYLLLRKLDHPNLVKVRGYRKYPDGHLAMAMEEARGVRIDAIATQPCWTPSKASIARQILAGLDPVHRAGFVHADLKPDHVIVEETKAGPVVTLLDLGLATRQGDWVRRGTLGWMPPEIFDGSAAWSVQSDLYLFGLILHQVIYGEPLFPAENGSVSILESRRGKKVAAHGHVDPRLREILDRLIDVEPRNRPSNARAVWEQLREIRPTDAASMPDPALCTGLHAFHGRDQEIEEFAGWLARIGLIRDPIDATYRVHGELGIGKSRLIELLVATAETMGWTPQPLPAAAKESESLRAVLLDPHERVRVELLESPFSEQHASIPDAEELPGAQGVQLHREITLNPLPRSVAQRIAQDALDGDALCDRVAVLSLGNPWLLGATCRGIDWLTEFAWRDFPEIVEDRFPERGTPPEEYIAWLKSQAAALPPRALESLALTALREWWNPWVVEEAIGRSWAGVIEDLKPFQARGLVIEEHGTPRLRSSTWEEATVRASRELRMTVRALLERTNHVRAPAKLVKLTELVIQLQLWEELRNVFDKAIRALLDEERYQEVMMLLYRTYNALPEGLDVATPEDWRKIGERLGHGDGVKHFARPTRLLAQFPKSIPPELRAMFRACFLADADRKPEGRELLAKEAEPRSSRSRYRTPSRFVPPSVSWIATYAKCWMNSDLPRTTYPEFLALLREWLAHPRFANPIDQFHLRFTILMRLDTLLRPTEYRALLEPMEEASKLSPFKDALFHLYRAAVNFRTACIDEAKRDADVAVHYFQNHPTDPAAQLAYQLSAAIAFENAQFKEAYRLGKRLVRIFLVNGRLLDCTWQLRNLALVELARGRIGMAVAQVRMAEELHVRAKLIADDPRREHLGLWMRWLACDPSVIPEVERALVEYPLAFHNFRTLGLHELGTGKEESGRRHLRFAVDQFFECERRTEGYEVLADWLELEVDLGNRAQAAELFLELQAQQNELTPKTFAHVRVTEADMITLGWAAPTKHPESILLDLFLDISNRDFGLHFWRTDWHLARFYHANDQAAEAAEYCRAARAELQSQIDTLEGEEQREGFRNRPGPRRFLAEADSWEVPPA